jgi:predicted nucleic acid-binding protein
MAARHVGPASPRTLDALHLAAALELGEDLDGLVAYDKRLAVAADLVGITVVSPGLPAGWWSS